MALGYCGRYPMDILRMLLWFCSLSVATTHENQTKLSFLPALVLLWFKSVLRRFKKLKAERAFGVPLALHQNIAIFLPEAKI